MQISNIDKCCGCTACESICPKKAISMKPDNLGFLYPSIDSEKCINCGLCRNICPANGLEAENEIKESFAVMNTDSDIRMKSSSGGVFSLLAKKVISQNGIVFGVRLDENQIAVFDKAENYSQLETFYGSKYVQAEMRNAYTDCKNEVLSGRLVLFSGTPCQIAGLKSFLKKEYENLICVDFICHGVPSPALWQKYVKYQEKKSASSIVKTAFRHKKCGWKQYSLQLTFANCSEYCESFTQNKYMQLFLRDNCLRESCYNCFAKGTKRFSDITIADFWGIQNIDTSMDDDKGTSFVCINSVKGESLFRKITLLATYKSVITSNGIKYNPSMVMAVNRSKKRTRFEKSFKKKNIDWLYKKFGTDSNVQKYLYFIKRIMRRLLIMIGIKKDYSI